MSSLTSIADIVASTEKMCSYTKNSPETDFIVATENGLIHRLKKSGKKFLTQLMPQFVLI